MRALVTGAGGRLGQAMAIALGQDGYDVAVHYAASERGANETAAAIRAAGQKAETLQADLLNPSEAAQLFDRAVEALGGPITLLINNASIFERDTVADATTLSWDRHIESNLRAPFVLSQAMYAQGLDAHTDPDGRPRAAAQIINMIDQRVRKPTPDFITYGVAKSGLWAMTKTMAQAMAPQITVNAIGPGPTLQGVKQTAEGFATQCRATLLQRGADPDDIVQTMRFLRDAPAITGQLICVDSGQHLAWETPDVIDVE